MNTGTAPVDATAAGPWTFVEGNGLVVSKAAESRLPQSKSRGAVSGVAEQTIFRIHS